LFSLNDSYKLMMQIIMVMSIATAVLILL
jgi:hypothetical protein